MGSKKIQLSKKLVWHGPFRESFPKEVRLKEKWVFTGERQGRRRHFRLKEEHRQRQEARRFIAFSGEQTERARWEEESQHSSLKPFSFRVFKAFTQRSNTKAQLPLMDSKREALLVQSDF